MMVVKIIKTLFPEKLWDCSPAVVLAIGVLWLVAKVGKYIYTKSSHKKMLARWNNTPKDLVIVHKFPAGRTAPNASPFVLKLETYLRLAKIPYETDEKDSMSVKGKSPWISLNGEHIADSQFCIKFLAKKFGRKIGKYSEEQRAIGTMARIMMEEHLYWGIALWRYVYTKGRDCHKFFYISGILLNILVLFIQRDVKKATWWQGLGRHSQEDVILIALSDMKALSKFIGKKKYLLGDEPCEDDGAVFGFLAQIVWCCPDSPFEKAINGEFINLKEYCYRMKKTFWPDWEDCLSGGKKQSKKSN